MLTYNPDKRISAEKVLQDPWLQKFTKQDVQEKPLISQALDNMRKFRADKKLQDALWVFLVNFMASKEEKNELLKTFKSLDKNNDGQLSKQELIEGYGNVFGNSVTTNFEEEVENIFRIYDKDNSGFIDYTEFVTAAINRNQMLQQKKLEAAFKMFDKNGDGSISISELKRHFGGDKISDNVWQEIVKEVDDDGNGEVIIFK